jgi:hypothetical protein
MRTKANMTYPPPMHATPYARFWRKVAVGESEGDCWLWTGATSDYGHGVMQRGRRGEGQIRAHRFSWEIHFGPIPEGMIVCHRCDVPQCVNPHHLFIGTKADNSRDMARKDRWRNQTRPKEPAHA